GRSRSIERRRVVPGPDRTAAPDGLQLMTASPSARRTADPLPRTPIGFIDDPLEARSPAGTLPENASAPTNFIVGSASREAGGARGRWGDQRTRSTPSFFIRDSSVVGFSPRSSAAPRRPLTRQPVDSSAARIWARSASSSV